MNQMQTPQELLANFLVPPALTGQELLAGSVLTSSQISVLANRANRLIVQIVSLSYSANKDDAYGLQIANLQGQLETISCLLDESTEAVFKLNETNAAVQAEIHFGKD